MSPGRHRPSCRYRPSRRRRHAEARQNFFKLPAGAMRTLRGHIPRPALKMLELFPAGPALIFINRHIHVPSTRELRTAISCSRGGDAVAAGRIHAFTGAATDRTYPPAPLRASQAVDITPFPAIARSGILNPANHAREHPEYIGRIGCHRLQDQLESDGLL